MYDLVLEAQLAGARRRRAPASPAADVDAACRDVFAEAGYGDWYLHGTGHGVGLEIHEDPFVVAGVDRRARRSGTW